MHIIDEMEAAIRHNQASSTAPLLRRELDPIVFTSEYGDVWTLGMVIPMWAWVFKQSADEVGQRGIAF